MLQINQCKLSKPVAIERFSNRTTRSLHQTLLGIVSTTIKGTHNTESNGEVPYHNAISSSHNSRRTVVNSSCILHNLHRRIRMHMLLVLFIQLLQVQAMRGVGVRTAVVAIRLWVMMFGRMVSINSYKIYKFRRISNNSNTANSSFFRLQLRMH